jgi:hypothetical protein
MDRLARTTFLLTAATWTAALVVVGTAPNDFPSLTERLSVALNVTATMLAVVFAGRVTRHRLSSAVAAALLVAIGVFLLTVLVWRTDTPVGAGNRA